MATYDTSDAIYGTGVYGAASYGSVSPTPTLTGVSATGSIAPVQITGFEIDLEENLDSVAATVSLGTIKLNWTISITGVSATGQQNSIVISRAKTLTGVSLTGSIGSLGLSNTVTLSGVSIPVSLESPDSSTLGQQEMFPQRKSTFVFEIFSVDGGSTVYASQALEYPS